MKSLLPFLMLAGSAAAQVVSEIKIRTDAEPARIRPLEELQLQVKAYSDIPKTGAEGTDRVRLNKGGAKVRLVTPNCGWLSTPFKFQGRDDEAFYANPASRLAGIISSVTKDYVLQDAVLFTAPEQPANCEVEAELEGKSVKLTIQVTNEVSARRKQENKTFDPEERISDPYRYLAEHWAPLFAAETWFQPKSDMAARFDFDGDWQGDNNWDNLETGSSQAFVYYAAMETATHWFLIYNVFHPRDYSDKCVAGSCHENDNEGLILTVKKDGSEFGQLQVLESLAHNNVYAAVLDDRIKNGVHGVEGRIELHDGSHPIAFIESGGHGIYPGASRKHSRFSQGKFSIGTGITYVYKGVAERPKHADDKLVGYELLPIYNHWWLRGTEGANWRERSFDDFYQYQPFGNRPGIPAAAGKISAAFLGRKEASNKARPFWGWFDNATKKRNLLNNGPWALDPAYAVSRGVRFPAGEEPSADYTFNPYLGVE